jgi:hypothetical protein
VDESKPGKNSGRQAQIAGGERKVAVLARAERLADPAETKA